MIAALTGTVFRKNGNPIIIMAAGVGYALWVPPRLMAQLISNGHHTFFVHTHVRQDTFELYGFSREDELSLFELLLTVPGIGPKTALLVVDRGVEAVTKAVLESDVDFFTTIPRLGKKNAQKIIIELKSKLGSIRELDLSGAETSETKELIDALTSMGFTRAEAISVIKKLAPEDKTLEQKIRKALRLLGK